MFNAAKIGDLVVPNNKTALTAVSDVYCNVVMNLDEDNISNKTLFTLTFMINFTYFI